MTAVVSAVVAALLVVSLIVNYAGLAAMAGMGMRAFWATPKGERKAAIVGAIGSDGFWLAFWVSGAAWLVNTLAPLLLLPFNAGLAWSLFTVNGAFNLLAIPFRGGILYATLKARTA